MIDTNISDQSSHQVALYFLDWDYLNRVQTIDVLDTNNNVLNSQKLSNFSAGVYLVWNVTGHVKFRITNGGSNAVNAVVEGLFFGGPSAAITTTAAPPIPQMQLWETRMLSGNQFCNAGDINAAIGAGGVVTEGNVWYYDGTKVYQQIAAYTKDPSWYTCAGYTNNAYTNWVLATTAGASWPVGALHAWEILSGRRAQRLPANG